MANTFIETIICSFFCKYCLVTHWILHRDILCCTVPTVHSIGFCLIGHFPQSLWIRSWGLRGRGNVLPDSQPTLLVCQSTEGKSCYYWLLTTWLVSYGIRTKTSCLHFMVTEIASIYFSSTKRTIFTAANTTYTVFAGAVGNQWFTSIAPSLNVHTGAKIRS